MSLNFLFQGLLTFYLISSEMIVNYKISMRFEDFCTLKTMTFPNQPDKDTLLTDSLVIQEADVKMIVISKYINDSILNPDRIIFYPLYISQEIQIFNKNKLLRSYFPIQDSITIITSAGNKISVVGNAIVQIGIIRGMDNYFFTIEGYGGCNSCPEYLEILNELGKTLFLTYHDKTYVYKNIGNLELILEENDIDETLFHEGKYLTKRINPLKY